MLVATFGVILKIGRGRRNVMHQSVLYRQDSVEFSGELDAIQSVFGDCASPNFDGIPSGSRIFTRFRSIPFGDFLEQSAFERSSKLVNSWDNYCYFSNVSSWVTDFHNFTAPAYSVADINSLAEGEYFVKGDVNSVKASWSEFCYAENLSQLQTVVENVKNHAVTGGQNVIIRPFVHFRNFGFVNGSQPLTNERRVFVLDGNVVADVFYWSSQVDRVGTPEPLSWDCYYEFRDATIAHLNLDEYFVAFDFAELPDGSWQLVEINDANMAGLCGYNPKLFWSTIRSLG